MIYSDCFAVISFSVFIFWMPCKVLMIVAYSVVGHKYVLGHYQSSFELCQATWAKMNLSPIHKRKRHCFIICFPLNSFRLCVSIASFRLDYEYEIEYEYDFSFLVFRLHIITTHTHFISGGINLISQPAIRLNPFSQPILFFLHKHFCDYCACAVVTIAIVLVFRK